MNLIEDTKRLLNAHGVSGNEYAAAKIAAEIIAPFVDEAGVDNFGNAYGIRHKENAKKILFDAHIDQIGYVVNGFTDEGFLRFQSLGTLLDTLIGKEVEVLTETGILKGIVSYVPSYKKLVSGVETKAATNDELFIDLGMDKEEVMEKVSIGDFIGFGAGDAQELTGSMLMGRSTDDRICFMAIARALELLKDEDLPVEVIATASAREEFDGFGARTMAWKFKPDYVIAVDVSGSHKPGSGAIITRGAEPNAKIADMLEETARAKNLPYSRRSIPEISGTNGKHFQIAAYGSIVSVVSFPQKYMHTPCEIVDMKDVENIGQLFAQFLRHFAQSL